MGILEDMEAPQQLNSISTTATQSSPPPTAVDQQPTASWQPTSPSATASKTTPILFALLSLVVLAVGATMYFGFQLRSQPLPPIATPVATPVAATGSEAGSTTVTSTDRYTNSEYGISFLLQPGERVIACQPSPDALSLSLTTAPQDPLADPSSECATDSLDGMILISKKGVEPASVAVIVANLQSPENGYQITQSPIVIGTLEGVRITGTRDQTTPAPLPQSIDEVLLDTPNLFYTIPASYLERDLRIITNQ
ncbi:hypothetical protein KA082_00780 [Candidatus Woesebacteria bacterium]|nr:hypothetical protein [Candidatus Woesebacteria bacterium]